MRAARPTSRYVLQLDDDIIVPPTLLQQLVTRMLHDPTAWMVTGYPFDVPPVGRCSLAAYCVLVYHLPLLIAFSIRCDHACYRDCIVYIVCVAHRLLYTHTREHHRFIWGGCMLMPLADLRDGDRYGFVKV